MSSGHQDGRSVSRRRILQALGGAGAVALAGCSGDGESGQTTPGSTADARTTADETTPTESVDLESLESEVADLSFEGRFFDTHAHWAGARDAGHDRLDPATFATRMDENDVGGCVLFTSSVDATQDYPTVLGKLASSDVAYVPFLQPQSHPHLVEAEVTDVYRSHETPFMGIGEIVFYGGVMQGTSLTADPWPTLFGFAAEAGIPLMIHPTRSQEAGLKTMLSEYPDATVMAHGGEFNMAPGALTSLLRNHENLYWTVDAGSMLNGLVLTAPDADAFASRYDQREADFKRLVGQILPPLVEAAPDRVMWGTDLATDWNTDPAVYSRVMDWTEAALASLPAGQRDKYAYANAVALFGA